MVLDRSQPAGTAETRSAFQRFDEIRCSRSAGAPDVYVEGRFGGSRQGAPACQRRGQGGSRRRFGFLIMDSREPGHSQPWMDPTISLAPLESEPSAHPVSATAPLTVAAIYDEHFELVWRSLRRLGIPPSRMDDATQDVFLVVHRKLGDFQQRS